MKEGMPSESITKKFDKKVDKIIARVGGASLQMKGLKPGISNKNDTNGPGGSWNKESMNGGR